MNLFGEAREWACVLIVFTPRWWLVNRNNALSSLHDGFWTLPALATLGLSGNPLASVSDNVVGLANTLTDLDLSYTNLKALPESLGRLTELV